MQSQLIIPLTETKRPFNGTKSIIERIGGNSFNDDNKFASDLQNFKHLIRLNFDLSNLNLKLNIENYERRYYSYRFSK